MILEGSYPYINGGVSSWMHNYIKASPDIEYVLWVIGAHEKDKGRFKYELADNVLEVHEVFLDSAIKMAPAGKKVRLTVEEKEAVSALIDCARPDWGVLVSMFQDKKMNPLDVLMSEDFLDTMTALCMEKYPYVAYAETFHTMRSMLLPVLYLLSMEVPEADMYHTVCTGYGGLLAVLAAYQTARPVMLTEHGIYSREREEEIIRATWVIPAFKKQWISFFYMLSDAIYKKAARITSLFNNARKTQIELGAPRKVTRVVANGIFYDRFSSIPLKEEDGIVDIGAVIRLAPIKDVKTLIYAFYELTRRVPNVRLHILGGTDDEEYAQECYNLAEHYGLKNCIFAGQVNVIEYMEKLDFTVLSSISEGQPLSVLESFAARRPVVTTEVGCCRDLIEGGEGDKLGKAGYLVPPMHREALAEAMERMCSSHTRRLRMGEVGQKRVRTYYIHESMMKNYMSIYKEIEEECL